MRSRWQAANRESHVPLHGHSGLHRLPAPRTLESHPNNLPMQPTTLVGREREVAEVSDLTGCHTLRKIALARLAVRSEDQSVAFLVMPKLSSASVLSQRREGAGGDRMPHYPQGTAIALVEVARSWPRSKRQNAWTRRW
jgi:hypothetical protein